MRAPLSLVFLTASPRGLDTVPGARRCHANNLFDAQRKKIEAFGNRSRYLLGSLS